MRISLMQPTYLPWLGYFELMDNCDVFVVFDDVQFAKKSWQQRNKIKSPDGELMLTVPVLTKGKRDQLIKDVLINHNVPWQKKHYISIEKNYQKTPYYQDYCEELKAVYSEEYTHLIDLNMQVMEFIKTSLRIMTKIVRSSSFKTEGNRTEKIVNICKAAGADVLYDAKGAKDILDLGLFEKNHIQIIFQDYHHPVYDQMRGEFISHLSALDLLFHAGTQALDILKSGQGILSV